MVYAQRRICPVEWDAPISLGFWNTNLSPNHGQTFRLSNKQKKKKKKENEKRTWRIINSAVPADYRVKLKEREKKKKYLNLLGNWCVGHESDGDTDNNSCSQYSHKMTSTVIEGFGKKRASGDHPNCSITEIGLNTEKSPGDLRRLFVSQTSVKNHRLMLAWNTRGENYNKGSEKRDK